VPKHISHNGMHQRNSSQLAMSIKNPSDQGPNVARKPLFEQLLLAFSLSKLASTISVRQD
jgi:hypothetical protein